MVLRHHYEEARLRKNYQQEHCFQNLSLARLQELVPSAAVTVAVQHGQTKNETADNAADVAPLAMPRAPAAGMTSAAAQTLPAMIAAVVDADVPG
jgi:hypothetical protein